jgi:hypothetical protein
MLELRRALAAAALGAVLAFAPPAAATPFVVAIKDGAVPRAQRVLEAQQDAPVRIEWSADRVTTVHLEGYDISLTVRPGQTTVMEFKAFASGRFPVHAHAGEARGAPSTHAHHGRGVLLRLEVRPK